MPETKYARITEVHDKEGNLTKLEAYDADTGGHLLDGYWDPTDEQTKENRERFRAWFTTMLKRKSIHAIN